MLRNALSFIRSVLITIPLIILSTVVMGSLALAVSLYGSAESRASFQDHCMRFWARMLLAASFVPLTTTGLDKIDPAQTYIFCCNHISYMDPPVILACIPGRVRFIAKKSLFRIPFLGWAMLRGGHVSIERERPRAAARDLERAAGILAQGTSLIIFPEGGRSLDGALQPFLSGAFRLAMRLQVPVVPVAIAGTRQVLRPGSIHIHGGGVDLILGEPIVTQGMSAKGHDELAARVRAAIARMLAEEEQHRGSRS